jgi:hypothetical protein
MVDWTKYTQKAERAVLKFFVRPENLLKYYEELCEKSFKAEKFGEAEAAAWELIGLLEKCNKRGFWWNTAHTILGQLALKAGDVSAAEHHLDQSIEDVADHVTRSFGPSLDLARELAQAGRSASVISYLDKHAQLAGVDHTEAFRIRYEVETGKVRNPFDDADYDEALFDWQYLTLTNWTGEHRTQQIKELIDALYGRIDIYGRPSPLGVNSPISHRKVNMFRRQIEQLRELEDSTQK